MNQKTKLIIFGIGGLLLFLVAVFGVTNLHSSRTKVTLRALGENIEGCSGWKGERCGRQSFGFSYNISYIPIEKLSPRFLASTGRTTKDFETYFGTHENSIIYVPTKKMSDGIWVADSGITNEKNELPGNAIFLKGTYAGYVGDGDNIDEIEVSFENISSSDSFTKMDFVDIFFNRDNDNVTAEIYVDKNGNASFGSMSVGGKICLESHKKPDFNDATCWKNYRSGMPAKKSGNTEAHKDKSFDISTAVGRDEKRISNMRSIRRILEQDYVGHYPENLKEILQSFPDMQDASNDGAYIYTTAHTGLFYHLGVSLETQMSALDTDADCNSLLGKNCGAAGYDPAHAFDGADGKGCMGEQGKYCYDRISG